METPQNKIGDTAANYLPDMHHASSQHKNTLELLYHSFIGGMRSFKSNEPREFLEKLGLNYENIPVAFCSGQYHHRKTDEQLKPLVDIGFLKVSPYPSNQGRKAFDSFGRYALIFPLRDEHDRIVNFHALRISLNTPKWEVLNDKGLYPGYPKENTRRLFITSDILDAASLIQSGIIDNRDAVIALHRDNLLSLLHQQAIKRLEPGCEIVLMLTDKEVSETLQTTIKEKFVAHSTSVAVVPEGEHLNSMLVNYGSQAIQQIVNERNSQNKTKSSIPQLRTDSTLDKPHLEMVHEHKLLFKTTNNHFYVLGSISQDLSCMKVTLLVEELSYGRKERTKLDLYERETVRYFVEHLADLFNQYAETLDTEFLKLTEALEHYRDQQYEQTKVHTRNQRRAALTSPEQKQTCLEFLKQSNLISRIDELIGAAGLVGEERTRKLLFIIASTYKMSDPLHALVQGSSGSGKSHLINVIGQCLPPEDVMSMTRVTSKSFYHYNKDELVEKLLLIQDYDGLDEEAQYAFRQLQSSGNISSSTTCKDRNGNITSLVKVVRSHFASLLATTKAEVYYDNMSRSLIIGVDESDAQTQRIITYQNKRLAGLIDVRQEQKSREFLQHCLRCIKPMEVVNHYADKIALPLEAKTLRHLNSYYHAFVKQIAILHQHQRKTDKQGRLIAQPEDLKIACDILFDAIMLKVDDLDSSLRQFFDRMKVFVQQLAKENNKAQTEIAFTQRDIRLGLSASKSMCFRFMEDLQQLEYLQKTGGYSNRGFKYRITCWDDIGTVREKIKSDLHSQLNKLQQPLLVQKL